MSFDSLLRHQASIVRNVLVLDGLGQPTYNELNHPITAPATVGTWRCLVQPRSTREQANLVQEGMATGDHVAFGRPTDLRASDRIELADGRQFEVVGIPEDGGGQGRHIEVPLLRVRSEEPPPPA